MDATAAAVTYGKKDLLSFVTLGDSRTQFNGNIRQEDVSGGGDAITKLDRGYMTWAQVLLRQRMRWIKNGGVGGDTTAMMLARTDALLDLNPGWLIGFGVINSVNSDVPSATIISELGQIFDKCAARGVKVVWGTDWCSTSTNTIARKSALYGTNEWLRQQVGVRPDFYLADYATAIVDPTTGTPYAALASDNLHQDGPGGLRMARQLVKVLSPLIPPSDRLIVSNLDTTNLLLNGMFEGDGGTGRATTWASGTGGTATYAKVARTDGVPGFWQQVTVSGATGSRLREDLLPGVAGSWVEGDKVRFEIEFETDAAGWNASQFYAGIQVFGATGILHATDCVHSSGTAAQTDRPESGICRTPAITIGAGATTVRVYVTLVGDGTYRVARARLFKATYLPPQCVD
ncbi:hypothetical protein Achl_2927 [Pseudarthrobacter chlorophenolicus A6]|uniref:SGNH hydrolase-type esterase domain-containing protein n=1 Tax=Pseudarthrobacter chlorophenolicus (strain ATCC 700700 / DSM 12829 / CIP 107037 / JCM 12360 / KCTC 9906 / NCIMB 13794 / A6) TaxID=452863 RepID=B8HEE5_PSECP|nr:SGNH/GDSL hydrolase family protein [Pseudarthrobacter chlorophenolicus]ACL40890.1 hypothetical protein Achl_2927 [Pseudarthrobacter chlorophenolicus A6]SDQ73354.1 hypothetical protein SAMN04489738_2552 [Pseudarthrobacter chlorophenolicus]